MLSIIITKSAQQDNGLMNHQMTFRQRSGDRLLKATTRLVPEECTGQPRLSTVAPGHTFRIIIRFFCSFDAINMLICALDVEERWLRQEIGQLRELLRVDNLTCSKYHCEFTKAIQSRLRAFDHDETTHTALAQALHLEWTSSAELLSINPRKAILTATRVVFRDTHRHGGIDYELAMHGIASLDQLEKHRLVLFSTVKREMTAAMMDMMQLSLLHELHNAATLHYGLFHMGFRAAILIRSLDPSLQTPKEHIMAKLNALFPPIAAANLDSVPPLAPYSDGLRENIRFSVYEHLMRGNISDATKWHALQTRLFSWCNIPGYDEARETLLRYTEEFKKMEEICLSTLNSLECRRRSICIPESPAESSFLTSSSGSNASPSPSSSFFGSEKVDHESSNPEFHYSFTSSRSLSSSARHTFQQSPLLRGMPGREISAAKTDGAAFAGDLDVAPMLTYPNDLSRVEFDQHPLAKYLDLSPREQTQLGLIIPKQLSSRNFYLGAREATNLDKAAFSAPAAAELIKTPRKLKMPFGRNARSVISSPELQPRHDVPSPFDLSSSDFANFAPSQSAPASRRQSIISPCESSYPRVDDPEDGPVLWKIAPPRLSPMEFARSRLIQTAQERREDELVSSGLTKLWFWTPRWESFLVLPRKKAASDPFPAQNEAHDNAKTPRLVSTAGLMAITKIDEPAPSETVGRSFLSCPRLSLNLGNLAIPFPSMFHLMSLDTIHPFRSLSNSTKSGSPPDSGESSRATEKSSIYAQQNETTSIPFPLSRGSQNQRRNQDFPSASPAPQILDRHNVQDDSSSLRALQIADNPSQDAVARNGAQITEMNSSARSWEESCDRAQTERCSSVEHHPPVAAAPRNVGLFPSSSAIAQRLHRRPRA
ncbi:hypothetical protein LLEC1_04965, partial [Akanthomyces lecanii]